MFFILSIIPTLHNYMKNTKTMNNKLKNITSLTFLLALVLMPILGSANDNNRDKDKDKGSKPDKEYVVCIKAFGQFLKRGDTSFKQNCHIPFKWSNATTTPDIISPTINSFTVAAKNESKAEIKWTTNEKSRAVVFYATTTPIVVKSTTTTRGTILESVYSTNAMTIVDNTSLSTKGDLTIKNLAASTTYYVVLAVRDSSGNVTVSNVVTLTTGTSSTPVDTVAPIINNIMTSMSLNKLLLTWKTNELSTSKLFYGTSTINVNSTTTQSMSNTTLKTNHSFELSAVASTTPYHVILQSTDASGNTQTSAQYSIYLPF
jgi:hypothetical protein